MKKITADMVRDWVEFHVKIYSDTPKITLNYILSFFRGKPAMTAEEIANMSDLEAPYRVLILYRPEVMKWRPYQRTAEYFRTNLLGYEGRLEYIKSELSIR